MALLVVPKFTGDEEWPTLGPQLCDFIEDRCIFGPGSLQEQPAVLTDEQRAIVYSLYELNPKKHEYPGRRRFQRGGAELRKGLAKTELGAWITFAELHPEAPVRFDGWDSRGNPVGRPVTYPYIPMMATTEEQVSDLAYSVLRYVVENGPDNVLFDSGKDRVMRLSERGTDDGKALPVAGAPNARDGALTTFVYFDEPHRLYMPRQRAAHETMLANLDKRPIEDPWALYTSTAGQPGQNSIQEDLRREAEAVDRGESDGARLFFIARWAGDEHDDLSTIEKRVAAIADATGPVGEFAPGQFASIAAGWDRKGADLAYLERVWLNRWRKSESQVFDLPRWRRPAPGFEPKGYKPPAEVKPGLARPGQVIKPGAFVAGGFDGARFRDSTAIVLTDIKTGLQELWGLWEQPPEVEEWEVPEDEVTAMVADIMRRFEVYKFYCDPPYWTETVGAWAVRWPDRIEEWWTQRPLYMARALREYLEAWDTGTIGHNPDHPNDPDFSRHLANAARRELKLRDDEGVPYFRLQKFQPELKFDAAMAAVLSGKAALDARRLDAKPRVKRKAVIRRLNPTR